MKLLSPHYDVAIVGAGIVGLGQAWAAAKTGRRVIVLEKTRQPLGASIRNFGMIWPIGQPAGTRLEIALAGRKLWLELAAETGLYCRSSGAVFVATDADEADVMREFADMGPRLGYQVHYLDHQQVVDASRFVRKQDAIAGLFSETELNIDPRQAVVALANHLQSRHEVRICWQTPVTHFCNGALVTAHGDRIQADRFLISQGDDAIHLFPAAMTGVELVSCKLHMLRSEAIARDMGPMLATGLTLRHYESFQSCRSLDAYRGRIARQWPDLDRFGIHVMVSQARTGELVLGDSHQYGQDISPFHDECIDQMILQALRERFVLPPAPVQRWQGHYLKRLGHTLYVADVGPDVRIVNALGGNGMTMALGIAERMWQCWEDSELLRGLPDNAKASPSPHAAKLQNRDEANEAMRDQ